MTDLENDRLLRALERKPVDRTPVWMMRQAGRYLPEYRRVREQAGSFVNLMRNPDLACEVTLQPLERFRLDAAILFSDILTIPDAMGLGLHFAPGEGPRFEHPVRDRAAIRKLARPDMEAELGYVFEAVRRIRSALDGRVPLIGFAGSPWTLATYMVEGGSSKDFARIKGLAWDEPATLDELMAVLSDSLIDYLNAQIESGAQAIQIFDTWGGVLTPAHYRRFSLDPMQRILDGLIRERDGRRVPVILFTKAGGARLKALADTGCEAVGVDWTVDLASARELVADRVALQGNLDPAALLASPERIRAAVADVLESYGKGPGHVFNLGHGITPAVPPEHAGAMIDAVHELSPAMHE